MTEMEREIEIEIKIGMEMEIAIEMYTCVYMNLFTKLNLIQALSEQAIRASSRSASPLNSGITLKGWRLSRCWLADMVGLKQPRKFLVWYLMRTLGNGNKAHSAM